LTFLVNSEHDRRRSAPTAERKPELREALKQTQEQQRNQRWAEDGQKMGRRWAEDGLPWPGDKSYTLLITVVFRKMELSKSGCAEHQEWTRMVQYFWQPL
jgi:hypothetical protein